MAKTERITLRVDPDVKQNAEILCKKCGISMSDAITLFLHHFVNTDGLPFPVEASSKSTGNSSSR